MPGSANMDNKYSKCKNLIKNIELYNTAVFLYINTSLQDLYDFTLSSYSSTSEENNKINPENELESSKIKPFGRWFEHNFKNVELNYMSHCGIFSVSNKDIIQHPKSYYENLIKYLENSSNPEAGHYFERAWVAVFHPMNHTLKIRE